MKMLGISHNQLPSSKRQQTLSRNRSQLLLVASSRVWYSEFPGVTTRILACMCPARFK
jgi:hypothetical protein